MIIILFSLAQIRTFKMNYKRIFGLKYAHFVTIDPATFEVTNTFEYADMKKLKVSGQRRKLPVL
jgi:hypothetical protein